MALVAGIGGAFALVARAGSDGDWMSGGGRLATQSSARPEAAGATTDGLEAPPSLAKGRAAHAARLSTDDASTPLQTLFRLARSHTFCTTDPDAPRSTNARPQNDPHANAPSFRARPFDQKGRRSIDRSVLGQCRLLRIVLLLRPASPTGRRVGLWRVLSERRGRGGGSSLGSCAGPRARTRRLFRSRLTGNATAVLPRGLQGA